MKRVHSTTKKNTHTQIFALIYALGVSRKGRLYSRLRREGKRGGNVNDLPAARPVLRVPNFSFCVFFALPWSAVTTTMRNTNTPKSFVCVCLFVCIVCIVCCLFVLFVCLFVGLNLTSNG